MKTAVFMKRSAAAAVALTCIMLLFTSLTLPASAGTVFKQIDLSSLTFTNAGTDTWKYSSDTDGSLILSQTASSNTIAISNIALDVGKAYTIEVKARFNEPYTNGSTDSRGAGLIFGAQSKNPWETGGRCYCAMIDRGNATRTMRVFVKGYTSTVEAATAKPADAATLAYTDWHTLRVTISEKGLVTFYFDGNIMGTSSDESLIYEGGLIGLVAYSVKTKVDFKDFCYTEGITTDEAVFSSGSAGTYNVTVHYIYEDGTKAFDDVIRPTAEGMIYSIITPEIAGYVPSNSIITGTMGKGAIEFTVKYIKAYTLTIHYVKSDGSKAFDDYTETNLIPGYEYSVESVPYAHYTADLPVVSGKIVNENVVVTVTYSPAVYKLTVKYVFADGREAAPAYTESIEYNGSYEVTSPAVAGYTPDTAVVSGKKVMNDLTITVTYTADSAPSADTTAPASSNPGGCGSLAGSGAVLVAIIIIPAAMLIRISKRRSGIMGK
jgi:hypothetical protein